MTHLVGNPHAISAEDSDRNPFLATSNLDPVLAVTSPFFTAVLDLANDLEPITIDSDSLDDISEQLPAPRTAKAPQTHTMRHHSQPDSDLGDVPAMKRSREAKDLKPFIHKHEQSRECKFCMCVTLNFIF